MVRSKMRWSVSVALFLLLSSCRSGDAVVNSGASDKDGPPGLIDIQGADDLLAEASAETQKREIPSGGLSNSYGEPIPADSYGPPPINDGGHSAQLILGVADSYSPPSKPDLGLPIPVYGAPDDPSNHIKYPELPPDVPPAVGGPPHETYGPPKVNFAHIHHSGRPEIPNAHKITISGSQQYHGPPPPPQYGPPKVHYGPPKHQYGPPSKPKPQYGPPKHQYGPPPKQIFGAPKPAFGPPPPPPKHQYGPPKQHYGPPQKYGPPPQPPKIQYGPPKHQIPPRQEYGPPKIQFAVKPAFLQKPHPVYGAPINHFEQHQTLKPLFPIPEDTYGPPGRPIGPGEHFSQHLTSSEQILGPPIGIHHGPPQPDPDPKPAHPGIPAPPTPPHILYDGWTPIPGLVSKPPGGGHHSLSGVQDNYGPPPPPPSGIEGSFISTLHSSSSGGGLGTFGVPAATYGVPVQSIDVQSVGGGHSSGSFGGDHISSGSFISGGYSSVAGNEGLQGIDLNSIIGSSHGDGIGLQDSKTVFEAHYTEGGHGHGSGGLGVSASGSGGNFVKSEGHDSFSVVQSLGFDISGSGGGGSSHHSPGRQLGHPSDIGLKPPSGIYGVPPGGKYGLPPPPPPHNVYKPLPPPTSHSHLAISYGVPSGSVGTGSINPLGVSPPKRPISFREPVPQGLIENIGQAVVQKDIFGVDHSNRHAGPYLPPPVQELPEKEPVQFASNHGSGHGGGYSIQASIEPSNLYSLPSPVNPINFHSGFASSHGDSFGASSAQNAVATTADGKQVVVVESSSDSENAVIGTDASSFATAILKYCPYHKALYEAAKSVEQKNAASSSNQNFQFAIVSANGDSNSESSSDSFQIVESQRPQSSELNAITDSDSKENQKGKSLNSIEEEHRQNFEQFKSIAVQQIHSHDHGQTRHQEYLIAPNSVHGIPVQGNLGSYTLQIQSADGSGNQQVPDSIPHEQVLSEGLLQSILQAIEQPHQTQIVPQPSQPQIVQVPHNPYLDLSQSPSGLVLPEGYEVVPRNVYEQNKEKSGEHTSRADQDPDENDEDAETSGSEAKPVIIVGPQEKITKSFLEQFGLSSKSEKEPEIVTPLNIIDDNEIAVYFNSNKNDGYEYESPKDKEKDEDDSRTTPEEEDTTEMVTEISVESSISAAEEKEEESQMNAQQYGDESSGPSKKGKFGDKIVKKVDSKAEKAS